MRRTEAPSEIPEVDVTLITRRLRMTPTERWEAHRKALELVMEIRRARARRLPEAPAEPRRSER